MDKQELLEEGIPLSRILNVLLKRKGLIILGTLVVTILGFIVTKMLPKVYVSEGIVSLSQGSTEAALSKGLEIPVYKNYSNILTSNRILEKYIKINNYKQFADNIFEWDLTRLIKPLYGYNKKDRVRSTENFILSIMVIGEAPTSQLAYDKCRLIGNFICTVVLNYKIGNNIEKRKFNLIRSITKDKQRISTIQYNIENLEEREKFIRSQLFTIPGSRSDSSREIVQVQANDKTAKYLSPTQQLMAVKVDIQKAQQSIKHSTRENRINQITLNFLNQISFLVGDNRNFLANEKLLDTLFAEMARFYSGKSLKEEILSSYRMTLAFSRFLSLKKIVYRFASGPTSPLKPVKPKKKLIILSTFFLAFLFFVFLAFLMEWWCHNKKMISEPETI